ncbi:dimeric dUTPase (all-alpha-NTP-PPase superfamily) [Massilia aurea]|uniref:Dimeric dUTPase (All-alpha-NTP-PPase superfamily) n=1 Tax=Massilia aurea TaxID=373040 RepID=A0A7W9X3I1_9BURK|nr:dUTP diphosphatase [Massilia aurea]MBB6135847.1 dimeric dUTPase (all-alpha-NTP-PPase superfamily) [Massilia aurea]
MNANLATLADSRLREMLMLQEEVNNLINSCWRRAENPWYRAIWTECAELVDHVGWKWWKQQLPNIQQIELELVDIFHFGLSDLLQNHTIETILVQFQEVYRNFASQDNLKSIDSNIALEVVENFALDIIQTKKFDFGKFCELSKYLGMSEARLYQQYVSKNVLNKFRQDHGYKSGKYVKMWHGREDNDWLADISAVITKNPAIFSQELYLRLKEIYLEVINGK